MTEKIYITADGGGSNGSRCKLWKVELQKLADEISIPIEVSHFPPGTSKWNKIEHRLFSQISRNWKGQPLISFEVIVELIASTTTNTGLIVKSLSFDNPNIAALGYRAIREHWHIENKLHWCLDMDFGQDHMQIKNRNYLRNCEMLSRIALNAIRLLEPKFRRPGRNESVSLSNVKHCLDWTLDENIMTVANLFVEGKI